jgi:tRNA-intron endonuclease
MAKSWLRKFGRITDKGILLHPVEAGYLLMKGILRIRKNGESMGFPEFISEFSSDGDFIPLFLVYSDLRDRGKRVSIDGEYLYGDRIYLPISERAKISIPQLYDIFWGKGEFILSVVDEESEITYYRVFVPELKGVTQVSDKRIHGIFAGDRVITQDREIFDRFFYGSEKDGLVALSILEALYLQEKGFLDVDVDLRRIAEKVEKNFDKRYGLYKDLKDRGLVVKTGFKFGSDFRVYDKITDVSQLPHSKYLVSITEKTTLPEVSRAVRLANSVRKKMVFAFERDGWKYLVLDRIKV